MDQIETVEFVKKYLEDLLTFFDLNLEVSVKIEDGIVVASIPHSERSSILNRQKMRKHCVVFRTFCRQLFIIKKRQLFG